MLFFFLSFSLPSNDLHLLTATKYIGLDYHTLKLVGRCFHLCKWKIPSNDIRWYCQISDLVFWILWFDSMRNRDFINYIYDLFLLSALSFYVNIKLYIFVCPPSFFFFWPVSPQGAVFFSKTLVCIFLELPECWVKVSYPLVYFILLLRRVLLPSPGGRTDKIHALLCFCFPCHSPGASRPWILGEWSWEVPREVPRWRWMVSLQKDLERMGLVWSQHRKASVPGAAVQEREGVPRLAEFWREDPASLFCFSLISTLCSQA